MKLFRFFRRSLAISLTASTLLLAIVPDTAYASAPAPDVSLGTPASADMPEDPSGSGLPNSDINFLSMDSTNRASAPSVELTHDLSYLIEMLSSAYGITISKTAIPVLWGALDAQARVDDPDFLVKAQAELDGFNDRFGADFCNSLLGKIKGLFTGATVKENESGGGSMDFAMVGNATYFDMPTDFSFVELNTSTGKPQRTHSVSAPSGVYFLPLIGANACNYFDFFPPVGKYGYQLYLVSDKPFTFVYDGLTKSSTLKHQTYFGSLLGSMMNPTFYPISKIMDTYKIPYPWVLNPYNPLTSDTVDVSVALDKILSQIHSQALANSMTITSPVSIPADTAAKDEQLASVGSASDFDTLLKALAGAGVAIDVGGDIPEETEKPTEGETAEDETTVIGKLGTIADALTNIKDVVTTIPETLVNIKDSIVAIPGAITDFFTLDMTVVSASFVSLQDTFKARFGGITQLGSIFQKSYALDMVIPVFTVKVPPELSQLFPGKAEIVIMDLRLYKDQFLWARRLLVAIFWVSFAKWLLDQFDVKLNVG